MLVVGCALNLFVVQEASQCFIQHGALGLSDCCDYRWLVLVYHLS